MNTRGDMNNIIEAVVFLALFSIVMLVVMTIWQPIAVDTLYPLLENTEAFPQGPTAVTLLNLFVLVAVAAGLIAFFNHAIGKGQRPPQYGYGGY